MSNLQSEIGSLSTAEKLDLLDVLWESLEADVQTLTAEQQSELNGRVARYENNPTDVLAWEQVKTGLSKNR